MIQVGDVLMARDDTEYSASYAKMFFQEEWHPITLHPNALFLIVNITDVKGDDIVFDVVSLTVGFCFQMVFLTKDAYLMLTILRGKSVVSDESYDMI